MGILSAIPGGESFTDVTSFNIRKSYAALFLSAVGWAEYLFERYAKINISQLKMFK